MRTGPRDSARSPTCAYDAARRPHSRATGPLRTTSARPVAAVVALTLGGCAHAPPHAPAWLEAAPAAERVERRAAEPMICRQAKPTGSHVEKQVCLTPEDDRLQRDAARQILRAAATAPWRGR